MAVIRASDVGVYRCLETLPEAVHPLALCAHYPQITSDDTLLVNTSALKHPSDAPLTVGRAARTIQKILSAAATITTLRDLRITTSARTNWTETTIGTYSNALAGLQDLTALALDGGVCSPPVIAATAAALPSFFALKSFSLRGVEPNKRETTTTTAKPTIGIWKLYEALQLCNQLEKLSLSAVSPADKDREGPSYLVFALTQLSGLCSLTLKNESVTADQLALLQMLLEASAPPSWMSGLVSLDLSANSLGDTEGTQALSTLLPRFKALQKIDLSNNGITSDSVQVLAPAFKRLVNLRHINFAGNRVGTKGAGALASAWLRLTKLEHLSMTACRMPAAATIGIAHVVAKYPGLQHLDLRGCSLAGGQYGIEGAQVLAHSLQKHTPARLLHFYHEDSGLRPVSARLLFRSLSHHTGLLTLHVRCVFLYDQHDDSLKEISWHLHQLPNLENLRFSCDKLSHSESEAFQAALYSLRKLKRLDLSHLWLGDAPSEFFTFLSTMTHLEELDLSCCNFVQLDAAEALARFLQGSGLKVLRMDKNALRDDSAQALAAVLPSLEALEQLAMSGTDITNVGANAIVTALDKHPSITACDLRENIFVHRKLLPAVQRKGWLLVGRR